MLWVIMGQLGRQLMLGSQLRDLASRISKPY
jgi:hypothetical protein